MTSKAYFSLGCFWEPQQFFSNVSGVTGTRVGYAGGSQKNPTYTALGDHTETLEIIFDNSEVDYQTLLSHFWQQHDATVPQKKQYRSVIFFTNSNQQKQAQQSKEKQEKVLDRTVTTTVEPLETFYEAEAYHQHYLDKQEKGQYHI